MPFASSRATRQARYSANTARAACGLPAASASTSCSGTSSAPKQRIAEGFPQPDLQLALLCAGQLPQVDPQRLGQLDQQ